MNLLHGVGEFFALDIGTNALRIVQLSGSIKGGFALQKYAYVPIDGRILQDTSETGKKKVGEIINTALEQAGIKTKNIAFGLPARKTYTTVVEVEGINERQLKQTLKYQLDQFIPMALDEAEVSYSILGLSPNDPTKAEVLVSSVSKEFAESQMEMMEGIGLNVIVQEPEPIAMARALNPYGSMDAVMIIDLGEDSTDLVAMYQGKPRLVRSIPGGIAAMARVVSETLAVPQDQARQFILRFGLAQDQLDGQVFKALNASLDAYAMELTKSAQFFQTKYLGVAIKSIILSGFAGVIPFLSEFLEAKTGVATVQGNPWQLVQVTPEQQQVLQSVASEFAVAIGLAERIND
ncbi:type IV pilus assembly protein PilM [Candidatus Saccharibacteria bacterium]|nr:type IV pilus assembly protein PilM [Candidatus Saccharibacteria bacterium]